MILEADLHDLVGEAEHDRVLSAHPLLHIHDRPRHLLLGCLISHLDVAVYVCRLATSGSVSSRTVCLSVVLQV